MFTTSQNQLDFKTVAGTFGLVVIGRLAEARQGKSR